MTRGSSDVFRLGAGVGAVAGATFIYVKWPEYLWTLVAQLRKKVEPDPTNPQYLLSEPWVGYRFSTE